MKIFICLITGFFVSFLMVPAAFSECNPEFQTCGGVDPCVEGVCEGGGGVYRMDLITLADDDDGDGIDNNADNCPHTANLDQADSDGDSVGNVCDNCPGVWNWFQENTDAIDEGDACTNDPDGDGITGGSDPCPLISNSALPLADTDADGTPDECENGILYYDNGGSTGHYKAVMTAVAVMGDGDTDGDLVPDSIDNCRYTFNPLNVDSDNDGKGDACDS